jgi:hypothetical protein
MFDDRYVFGDGRFTLSQGKKKKKIARYFKTMILPA